MFIGITGTLASGVDEVIKYLVHELGFRLLTLDSQSRDLYHGLSSFESFKTPAEMHSFATSHWYENFVMIADLSSEELENFLKRPFFLLVSVDGSIASRYERYKKGQSDSKCVTLEQFVAKSEELKYQNDCILLQNIERAQLKLINNTKTTESLYEQLTALDLQDPERLRPAWDSYFMSLANLAALRSNCMKRRVGCVIVRQNRVIATGYNGTPRNFKNCNEGGCPRCNSCDSSGVGLSTCLCLHAEENALLEAGRDRIGSDAAVYCNTCPCLTCSIKIVQTGIREVIFSQSYSMDKLTSKVFKQSGVILRQFTPARSGIVIIE
ncbi:DEKNAAC102994 [Brettanomyces naardenensis]|uniref:Deoxycytidylate deaminase n=1 Tax=Brettanomyces naardenensis TaxID=13370 RepID=A0A448YM59_BRENA|nr:DEKNAAC102994 [Brettanomyces naardenensis]